jgi:hypothetical protein
MCLPRFMASQAVAAVSDPAAPVNFATLNAAVAQLNATSRSHLTTPEASALKRGEPVAGIVASAQWKGRARVHEYSAGALGGEVAWEASCGEEYFSPAESDSRYMDIRFDDGVFVRIPKDLDLFDQNVCMEIGCLRTQAAGGGMHRLLVLGDRKQGGYRTLSYEVYASE